jgi:hypothetical protein
MSPGEARDEMLAVFKAAWDPTGYAAVWTDVAEDVPANDAPWARPSVRHFDGRHSSLANHAGVTKHTAAGILTVQVFAPKGDGGTKAYELAHLLRRAYSTARGSVWYRNPRIREAGDSGAYTQINVLIDFTYDD